MEPLADPSGAHRAGPVADVALGLTTAPPRDLPVAFDATAGWAGVRAGLELSGNRSFREEVDDGLRQKTVRWGYGAAARVSSGGVDARWRLDVGADLSYQDRKDGWSSDATSERAFDNDDTLAVSASLGARSERGPWAVRAAGFVGWARVGNDSFAVDADEVTVFDSVRTDSGPRVGLRSRVRRSVADDRGAVRWVAWGYDQRGERLVSDGVTWSTEPVREQFLRNRVHLDWDLLGSWAVPTVFVGLDAAHAPGETALSPLLGVGFVQEVARD